MKTCEKIDWACDESTLVHLRVGSRIRNEYRPQGTQKEVLSLQMAKKERWAAGESSDMT